MFGYIKINWKQTIGLWLSVLLLLALGAVFALGYNSITNSLDIPAGIGLLADMFGGLPNLGGIALALLALGLIVWGLFYMSGRSYAGQRVKQIVHIAIGVALLVLVFYAFRQIDIVPDDVTPMIGTLIGVIVFVTVATWALLLIARSMSTTKLTKAKVVRPAPPVAVHHTKSA